jgi:hypothetical protein
MGITDKKLPKDKPKISIDTHQVTLLTGCSINNARIQFREIYAEIKEAGAKRPKFISIEVYAQYSGLSVTSIKEFFNH